MLEILTAIEKEAISVHSEYSTDRGIEHSKIRNWKISLILSVMKSSEKLIISYSFHQNNRATILITKLVEKWNRTKVYLFYQRFSRRIWPKIRMHSGKMILCLHTTNFYSLHESSPNLRSWLSQTLSHASKSTIPSPKSGKTESWCLANH